MTRNKLKNGLGGWFHFRGRAYEELYERFAAFIRAGAPLPASGRLDRAQFNVLYEGIQTGAVSQRDFLLAPALRLASPSSLKASPELLAMRERVWGAG